MFSLPAFPPGFFGDIISATRRIPFEAWIRLPTNYLNWGLAMIFTHGKLPGALVFLVLAGLAQSVSAQAVRVPEGVPMRLQMLDKLTSASAIQGQRFNLELQEDLRVGNQLIVAHGAKAVGTVVYAQKRGHMGKAGELDLQVNYLLVDGQRLPLRASSGNAGDSKVGATAAMTFFFGVAGLLTRGKDVEINPGTVVTAEVDSTTEIVPAPAS
jgi:hypothetical protein